MILMTLELEKGGGEQESFHPLEVNFWLQVEEALIWSWWKEILYFLSCLFYTIADGFATIDSSVWELLP